MSELADFITARLDEDEATARGAYRDSVDDHGVCHAEWVEASTAVMWGDVTGVSGLEPDHLATHIARHDPARVLADVEAKRRIVAAWVDAVQAVSEAPRDAQAFCSAHARGLRFAVLLLALPYADHPDYRQEWKP